MKYHGRNLIALSFAGFLFLVVSCQINPERQWPVYRGYMSSGVLDGARIPETFDIQKNINIKWKIDIPGLGIASPVIWGDDLFLTTAVSSLDNEGFTPGIFGDIASVNDVSEHEWKIICVDKKSGSIKWEKTACKGVPKMKRHPKSTHANTSVATDGKYIVAFFGSEGLYCYDFSGNLLWKKNFGVLKSVFFIAENAEWEFASSPIIYNGVVIIQCDVLENSFVAAFDTGTGNELWKSDRDEYPGWCTPNIYSYEGRPIVVVNGYKHRGGYDFKTGKEVWRMSGGGDIQIPTPIIGNDLIYFNSAHGSSSPILAIKKSAVGDITLKDGELSNEFVKWSIPKGGSYMHTMILYDGYLYNIGWNGSVKCINPLSGEEIYDEKLGKAKSFAASPVATDGRIYVIDEEGNIYIIKSGPQFQIIAEIPLGDFCMTPPAITDGIMFFRTQKHLIAVGSK